VLFIAYMVMMAFTVVHKCRVECLDLVQILVPNVLILIPNILYYVIKLIVSELSAIWSLSIIPCLK